MSKISTKIKHKPITFSSNKISSQSNVTNNLSTTDSNKSKNEIYLQPEILPYETMIECLKMRGMSSNLFKNTNVRKVVEKLFYKHITPKPQREYKLNRQGTVLWKMRKKLEKKFNQEDLERMVSFEVFENEPKKTQVNERVKSPPSSCINENIKVIKLNKSPNLLNSKIKTEKRKSVSDESGHKKIKLKETDTSTSLNKRKTESKSSPSKKHKAISWP